METTPRRKGAQLGNQNAKREHTRLVVSFSGVTLELAYEWLAELGDPNPSPERVKAFIRDTFKQVAKNREKKGI